LNQPDFAPFWASATGALHPETDDMTSRRNWIGDSGKAYFCGGVFAVESFYVICITRAYFIEAFP
jgi:hypothetical protein